MQEEPNFRTVRSALLRDPFVLSVAALILVLALPFYLPLLPQSSLKEAAFHYSDFLLLLLTSLAFFPASSAVLSEQSRRFYQYCTIGFGFWLLIGVLDVLSLETLSIQYLWMTDVFSDILYLLFYLSLVMASAVRPDRRPESHSQRLVDNFDASGSILFIFGLLVYFIVIPITTSPADYDSWLPSLLLYVVLDLYLAVRFGYLASTTPGLRWRATYGLMTIGALSWALLDFIEALSHMPNPWLEPYQPTLIDPFWSLPFLIFVAAARVRDLKLPDHSLDGTLVLAETELDSGRGGWRKLAGPLVMYTFLFPFLHLGLHTLGLLAPEGRFARELLVLFFLISLGSMALVKQHLIENRNLTLREQRRQAEEAIRLLEKAFQTMPLGLTITDLEGRILFTNPAEAEMHGYSVGELVGRDASHFGPAEFRSGQRADTLWRAGTWHRESLNIRRDGSSFPVQLISHVVRDQIGYPIALVTSCEDITERKRSERRAQRMEHLAALGQMSATLAHEIRNPLGAIALNLRYLSDLLTGDATEPGPEEAAKEALETMDDLFAGVERLQGLVQGILNFTRPLVSNLTREDLSDVLTSALGTATGVAKEAGVEVVRELRHPPTKVDVDAAQIKQVLTNLIENAVQAMPEGGRITVTSQLLGDTVEIRVSDTGSGISPDNREKIFQPFFTTKVTGIGLGLAIVFRILEQHGGHIAVEDADASGESTSAPTGSTFVLTLPVAGTHDPRDVPLDVTPPEFPNESAAAPQSDDPAHLDRTLRPESVAQPETSSEENKPTHVASS